MFLYLLVAFVSLALFLYFGIPKAERPSLLSLVGGIMSDSKTHHGFEFSVLSVGSLLAGGIAMFILYQSNQTTTAALPQNQPAVTTTPVVPESTSQTSTISYEESVRKAWEDAEAANREADRAQDQMLESYSRRSVKHTISSGPGPRIDSFVMKDGSIIVCGTTMHNNARATSCR